MGGRLRGVPRADAGETRPPRIRPRPGFGIGNWVLGGPSGRPPRRNRAHLYEAALDPDEYEVKRTMWFGFRLKLKKKRVDIKNTT